MASTNGLQNNALVVNTIDGLTTLYATSIYDNGQAVDPGSYVPYTGALFNVDLNNNQLNDVNSLQVNSSIAAASLTTTGLITTNTLKINSVPSGTQTNLLAVDSSGNVIQGSSPTQIQINAGLTNGTPYYLTFVPSNTGLAKNESLYTEAYYNGYEIQYSPATQTLSVYNINIAGQVTIPNLGSSASPSYYVALNASNQMVKVSAVSAQPNITQVSASGTYYPVFVNSNSAQSGATIYVDPLTSPLAYTYSSQTLTCKNLQVSGSTIINGYALLVSPAFTGVPTVPTPSYPNSNAQIVNTAYVATALSNFIPLQGSIAGLNLNAYLGGSTSKFNIYSSTSPYTLLLGIQQATSPYVTADSLSVTNNLTVGGTTTLTGTATAPTATAGTNTTQIATTAFVQSAIGSYLPLTGGSMSGAIVFGSGVSPIIQMTNGKYVSYNYTITDSGTAGTTTWMTFTTPAPLASPAVSPLLTIGQNTSITGPYLLLNNTSNPCLIIGSGLNYVAYATSAGAFINDSAVGDLCINSRSGNIRLAGGSQYTATGLLITNSYLYPKLPIQMSSSQGIFFSDTNKGIQYNGANTGGSYWANSLPTDGVSVFGWADGVLGTKSGGQANSLYWNTTGITVYGNLNFNGGGQIGSNSGTLYGSFSATVLKNAWSGMSMWNNRHYCMSNQSDTFGLYDQNYNWLVRGYNGALYFDSIPYQNYNPGYILLGSSGNAIQYGQMNLTNYYYTGTWGGGASLGSISKGQTNSVFWLTGMSSYYVSTAGNVFLTIRLYNTSLGIYFYYNNATMFTNVTYNHVSYPINLGVYSLPAGTYNIYVYLNGSYITDANDYIYLSFRVTP